MKKFTSLFVVFVLIVGCVPIYASGGDNCILTSLGDYGDREYIYENFELKFTYDGNTETATKDNLTYNEFDALITALSHKHLAPAEKKPEKLMEITDDEFPQEGYVEFLDENDGNWVIGFDEDYVYARCINPQDKSYKHGFFTYTGTIDMGLWAFLKNIAKGKTQVPDDVEKEDPETDLPVQEETKRNRIEISGLKELYSAHFPLDKFSDAFSWGVCSYRRENESKDVTVAYITFEGMEFLKIITDGSIKDNTIVFDDGRVAYTKELPGEEYDTDFDLTHNFKLTVDVNEEMQVENARITYTHKSTKVTKTVDVDMDTYVQKGSLPKTGKMAFSRDNNSLTSGNKEDEEKVTEEKEQKEEKRVYSQTFAGDINSYILREKFYFTFKADKSFEGVLTEEVAEIGEEVSVEVRIYLKDMNTKRNGEVKFYNVTILKGSKGTAQLWGGFDYELGYFPLYKPTDMVMHAISANRYLTGSYYEPLVRYSGEGVYNHRFMIKPEFDGTEIKGIKIKYVPEINGKYDTHATMEGATECENVRYELLVPLTEITEKEKKEEEALENRNPEKYVTKIRGEMSDGSYHDYRINSVHMVSLKELDGDLPAWYKELGDDVNMYLLSFTQVWDGKDRNNYTMVKLEGKKDSVWFINGNAEFGKKANESKYVVCDYNSLISFDGFERVRNTVEYDTITISADFSPDDDMTMENMSVEIEGEEITFSEDEITYIGGGKMTYESFF